MQRSTVEANMLGQQIEAVFENGVFRPLEPINLPEHQRVTLLLPASEPANNGMPAGDDEFDEEVGYQPLPLQQCRTIRVRLKPIGELPPLPYPIETDDQEQE
jgi:predicted DNA-binding antitoxin AbrB/MazE fold protein